jgi:hypothetical protein
LLFLSQASKGKINGSRSVDVRGDKWLEKLYSFNVAHAQKDVVTVTPAAAALEIFWTSQFPGAKLKIAVICEYCIKDNN